MAELTEKHDAHGRVLLISCDGSLCSLKWSRFVWLSCKRESNGGVGADRPLWWKWSGILCQLGTLQLIKNANVPRCALKSGQTMQWKVMARRCNPLFGRARWCPAECRDSQNQSWSSRAPVSVDSLLGPHTLISHNPNHQPYAPKADRTSTFITSYMSTITSSKKYSEI